jgi:CDP-diacylglycerol--glycerol-3-phosphate 3-phosphatidyltransferase
MLRWIPNILTLGRFVLSIIFLLMILYVPHPGAENRALWLDTALVIFIVAGITDRIDGDIARRLNVTSRFGRMVDPLADKVLVGGAFVCFAIKQMPPLFDLSGWALQAILWAVAAILIAREVYVTILRQVAEARGVNFAATLSGKIKMFLQSFAIGTVLIKVAHVPHARWGDWFTLITFLVMLTVTVYSGLRATQRTSWQQARNLTQSPDPAQQKTP